MSSLTYNLQQCPITNLKFWCDAPSLSLKKDEGKGDGKLIFQAQNCQVYFGNRMFFG